ncbi:hypothetical protein C6W96_19860 [Streptomyces sp. CS149]|uniref:hypothetical protein n=1 Tax=Streptomyces sp. CS149 TaxID=2109332 RepID=UPI000D1A99F0|nr:hypothetical protein [Streptomyces sp. CS149]PSK70910.1 hypothetical protein C6W96_19860 [Streptomyces sp. CS149]
MVLDLFGIVQNRFLVQTPRAGTIYTMTVVASGDGIQVDEMSWSGRAHNVTGPRPDLVEALVCRNVTSGVSVHFGVAPEVQNAAVDHLCRDVLTVPRSSRWREAASTALLSDWDDPLWQTGRLSAQAVGALRAEARAVHRQLVPLWRRRTRHGRVLSLDADLGSGMSLHELVAADVDLLDRTERGVYEDARLNGVLRGLKPVERQVLYALAEGEGTTWTEAAVATGAADPEELGERVRRKAKRLAAEQKRRAALRRGEELR